MNKPLISVVIPCYNEGSFLKEAINEIEKNIICFTEEYEILLIEDGSFDNTFEIIKNIADHNKHIKYIKFARNFGKESAIHAGLLNARGEAVIVMDADLQHPPELLKDFYEIWESGAYKIVEAVKNYNFKGNLVSKLLSKGFNYLMFKLSGLRMEGSSDFKLLDRVVVEEILSMPERNRFFRGLVNWTGYNSRKIYFDVPSRLGGKSKWSIFSLFKLSISAISSFSNIPLYVTTSLGVFTLIFSFILSLQTLYNRFFGFAVSGFTTVIIIILSLSSLIMISLGIIGIYISNIYLELKKRPYYIVTDKKIE